MSGPLRQPIKRLQNALHSFANSHLSQNRRAPSLTPLLSSFFFPFFSLAMFKRPAAGLLRRWPTVALRSRWQGYQLTSIRAYATPAKEPSSNDAFANGTNAYYAEQMYRHWKQDPKSVHPSWDAYFSGMDKGLPSSQAFQPPPNLVPTGGAPALHAGGGAELDDHLKVSKMRNNAIYVIVNV